MQLPIDLLLQTLGKKKTRDLKAWGAAFWIYDVSNSWDFESLWRLHISSFWKNWGEIMSTIYSRLKSPSLPSSMQVMGPPDGTQVCRTLLEGSIQIKHSGIHTVCQAVIGPVWSYLDLYAIWCRTYAYIISVHHATFTLFKGAWNGQRSQSSTVPSAHPTNACKQPQFASAELQLSTSKISSTYCYHLLPLHEVVTSERLLFHHCQALQDQPGHKKVSHLSATRTEFSMVLGQIP